MESQSMLEIRAIKNELSNMSDKERMEVRKESRALFEKMSKRPITYVQNTSSEQLCAKVCSA